MARLRAEAEAREYAALTNKSHPSDADGKYKDDEYTYGDPKYHVHHSGHSYINRCNLCSSLDGRIFVRGTWAVGVSIHMW